MPELGHDVKDFQVYTWQLNDWKKLDKKLTIIRVCRAHSRAKFSGVYYSFRLETLLQRQTTTKKVPEGWHACVQFALVICNIHHPTVYIVSRTFFLGSGLRFGLTNSRRPTSLHKLFHPQEGHSRPIIEEDSADITVYVRVLEDPTGVLWHNFVNYDSKKETGYVGLKNQGTTSYMNSLLQSLYCTRYFRRAVYQIPTEDEIPTESVALALQRVFYHLQISDQPVGTTELTKSLGWTSFLQHDVQEFNRVLVDKLESKMKGTKAEGAMVKLLAGKLKSYIKCVDVDYESSKIEEFNDIQLNVKGMKNLYESFRDYVAVEMLDGENKYQASGFGLQDAKKGIIFESFPPVLHLQLKRFEYDLQRDAMVKVNDRHEFPFELDLGEFLDSTADRSKPWVYKLHGVIVHSGDHHGGHYFALIKPDRDTRWLKYDDDRVTPVTDKEVLEENYGGEAAFKGLLPTTGANQVRALKRFTNAYMLVYIRESAIDGVLAPFTAEDIPLHLSALNFLSSFTWILICHVQSKG
ncbi:hypothetical protein B0H13DRAFT_2422418 [Mycena leptocephala]|nr:hypothetical protein B0H13DRAFT_2422418 [Mycena leptocephala]